MGDAERHGRLDLGAPEVAHGPSEERPGATLREPLAHHPIDAELGVDFGVPHGPAARVPLDDDSLAELGPQASLEHVAGALGAESADVDASRRDALGDHVRARRVVRVEAAGAQRENEDDSSRADDQKTVSHAVCTAESSENIRRLTTGGPETCFRLAAWPRSRPPARTLSSPSRSIAQTS